MKNREPLAALEYGDVPFEVWKAMWLDYIGTGNADLSQEVHRFTYDRIKKESTSLRGFDVATTRPVGFVHYYFHPSSYNLREACTIGDLYVASSCRGKGIGRWLIERVAAIATAEGAPALHWRTGTTNTSAIALYRTLAKQADVLAFRKQL